MSIQIAGQQRTRNTNFSELIKSLMNGNKALNYLKPVWVKHKKEILAHFSNFKLFRDKFIDHYEIPSTPSTTLNLTEKRFRLSRLSYPSPSEEEELRISNELRTIARKGSNCVQTAINGQKGLALCRELLKHSHEFEWQEVKDMQDRAAKFGFETPYFDQVGEDILQLTSDWAATLLELVVLNVNQIRLG